MAGETQERVLITGEFDARQAVQEMAGLSATWRQFLEATGGPEATAKLKALDEFDTKLRETAASMDQLRQAGGGEGGGGAAPALEQAGQAAEKAGPKMLGMRHAVSMLGAELAQIIGIAPQFGSSLSMLLSGFINPWTAAVVAATGALVALNSGFAEADKRARDLHQRMVEMSKAVEDATAAIAEYYQTLNKVPGAPSQMAGFETATQGAVLQLGAGLTQEQAAQVIAQATAVGMDETETNLFASIVASGQETPESADVWVAAHRANAPATAARYRAGVQGWQASDLYRMRSEVGRKALQDLGLGDSPEARLRRYAELRGMSGQVNEALGEFSTWRQLKGIGDEYNPLVPLYRRFGYRTELEKMRAAQADPAVRQTAQAAGVVIQGNGSVTVQLYMDGRHPGIPSAPRVSDQ